MATKEEALKLAKAMGASEEQLNAVSAGFDAGTNTTTNDYNPNEIIGAGPNAGMTAGEVAARDAANGNPYGGSTGGETTPITQNPGESLEDYKARLANRPIYLATGGNLGPGTTKPTTLSADAASALTKQYGLTGLGYSFTGMSPEQASAKAKQLQQERLGQTSANTSSVFNTNSVKDVANRFQLKLNENTATPWDSNGAKAEGHKAILETFANDYAKQFSTADDLNKAYATNATVKSALDQFTNSGGTIDQITSKITAPVSAPVTNVGNQSLDQFLTSIGQTTPATEEQKQTFALTAPERVAAEKEIIQAAGVKDDLLQYYYGDTGLYEQKKALADEKIKLAKQKEENDASTLREKMQAANDRLKAQAESSKATIETNRIAAKNYMSGMLAKLGALNTTSAAPIAISELDAKYQKQSADIDTNYNLAINDNEVALNSAIRSAEETRDQAIYDANNDLSLTKEEASKAIFNAKISADKEINKINSDYAKTFTDTTAKYTEATQKKSDEYLKKYGQLVGANTVSFWAKMVKAGTADISNVPSDLKNEVVVALKGNIPQKTTETKADKTAQMENDIASSVLNFRDIVKQNQWAGIDPTQYAGLVNIIKNKYGASAVLKLEKALEDAGLSVDNG